VTDPTTPASAVLRALNALQAEIALVAPSGLEVVVLSPSLFDMLAAAVPVAGSIPPTGPRDEMHINLAAGLLVVRRAKPYQPLVAQMPLENRQHLLDQMNAASRRVAREALVVPAKDLPRPLTSEASISAEVGRLAYSGVPVLEDVEPSTQRLAVVRTGSYGMSGRPPDHVHREETEVPPKPAVKRLASPNFNDRKQPIDVILLHHTGSNSTHGALLHLCDPAPENNPKAAVSAHYVVSPEGLVWQLVSDEMRAWHAGECELRGEKCDMNGRSIGIELVNAGDGKTPFTDAQYAITRQLVAHLQARYQVPWENVLGHRDVAVPKGRKTDPADNFDWSQILTPAEMQRRRMAMLQDGRSTR
jgi:N-acetyl-anhydromuramyl-L-alanine amidase AmpD